MNKKERFAEQLRQQRVDNPACDPTTMLAETRVNNQTTKDASNDYENHPWLRRYYCTICEVHYRSDLSRRSRDMETCVSLGHCDQCNYGLDSFLRGVGFVNGNTDELNNFQKSMKNRPDWYDGSRDDNFAFLRQVRTYEPLKTIPTKVDQ